MGIPLHRIFPTQGLNPHLLHCRKILDRLSCSAIQVASEPVPQVHLLEEPFFTNCSEYSEQLVNQKCGCRHHFHKSKPWTCAILASSLLLKTWPLDSNHRLCSGNSHPHTEERQTCVYLTVSVRIFTSKKTLSSKKSWIQKPHVLSQENCYKHRTTLKGIPGWCSGKEPTARDVGDPGLIPGLGGSPAGGQGSPLRYSCLENPMDRGAWWATVCGAEKSWTWLSTCT